MLLTRYILSTLLTTLWQVIVYQYQYIYSQPNIDFEHMQIDNDNGNADTLELMPMSSRTAGVEHTIIHGNHFHTEEEMEENSGYLLLLMIGIIVVTQLILLVWKRLHHKSYDFASLLLLWLIPCIFSVYQGFYLMITIWILFSSFALYLLFKARQRPLQKQTPAQLYTFFYYMFQLSYYIAVGGYFCILSDIVGFTSFVLPSFLFPLSGIGVVLLWYGLYYGCLVRDIASISSTLLTTGLMSYGNQRDMMPIKQLNLSSCAICDKSLPAHPRYHQPSSYATMNGTSTHAQQQQKHYLDPNEVYRLDCSHSFHSFCLRGYLLVARKEHCPVCNEKVNTQMWRSNPFELQRFGWSRALEYTRVLVVFIPSMLVISGRVLQTLY